MILIERIHGKNNFAEGSKILLDMNFVNQ